MYVCTHDYSILHTHPENFEFFEVPQARYDFVSKFSWKYGKNPKWATDEVMKDMEFDL